MNQIVHIKNIALPDQPAVLEILKGAVTTSALEEQAEVNACGLFAMCRTLTPDARSVVSESLLFAQLAADAAHDKFLEQAEWTETLVEVMEMLGWRVLQEESHGSRMIDSPKRWSNVAQVAFERGYGGPARLVRRMLSAAGQLPGDATSTKRWAAHGVEGCRGQVLLGHVNADSSDDPVISMMCAQYETHYPMRGILGWDATGVWSNAYFVLSLNTDTYDQLRTQVRERLGLRLNTDINQIAL